MIDPDRWPDAKAILTAALERPENERAAFVAEACGNDEVMRRAIGAMLFATPAAFMQGSALEDITPAAWPADDGPVPEEQLGAGARLGPYTIERAIGHGGMGQVYEATRSGDFNQRVAIKIIRREMAGGSVLQRFRSERQILASLNHPYIAALLDGGTAPDGRPYFVLELVDGIPIDDYARPLPIRDRIQLFLKVCDAVNYAHQRLVVHRDLKPRNILVTADGSPKLLDFGIAKLLQADGEDLAVTAATRPMTPEYASPEQIRGEPMTTATDVHALGVVLYELLAGIRPYTATSTLALLDAITNADPRPPSAVAPPDTRRVVSGDLDAIVLTALRKEPSRRYGSVQRLAEDLQRYLDGRPVTAQKDSRRYRARKFVRRHRVGVAAATVALLSLVVGTAVATWQASVANRERRRAEQRFNDVRRLANSLVFEIHDALDSGPAKTRELLLTRAREYLEPLAKESTDDVALQHEIANTYTRIAETYGAGGSNVNLGQRPLGRELYRQVIDIRERIQQRAPNHADNTRELAYAYASVARNDNADGRPQSAWPHLEKSLGLLEAFATAHPTDIKVMEFLATTHFEAGALLGAGTAGVAGLGRTEQARAHLERSLVWARRYADATQLPEARMLVATVLGEIANWHGGQGQDEQGLPYGAQAIEVYERLVAEHPQSTRYRRELGAAYGNRGVAYRFLNRFPEALAETERSVRVFEQAAAHDPSDANLTRSLAIGLRSLGVILDLSKRPAEAAPHYARALAMFDDLLKRDPDSAFLLRQIAATHLSSAATLLIVRGPDAAVREIQRGLAIGESLIAKDAGNVTAWRTLAMSYAEAGKASRAAAENGAPGRWRQARDYYARSVDRWRGLQKAITTLPPPDAARLDSATKALAECDAALKSRS